MSMMMRGCYGRPLINRQDATTLGELGQFVVDVHRGAITGLVLGSGKSATVVDWTSVASFGPDAIVVDTAEGIHAPKGALEENAAAGTLNILQSTVLDDEGNSHGPISDVSFDEHSGWLTGVHLAETDLVVPTAALRGLGSHALMVVAALLPASG